MNPYLSLGTQGATGVSTGPHFHFEVLKDGKRFPITGARKDVGQYLEVLTPGSKSWSPLFSSEQAGFKLNPAGTITSEMGRRAAPTAGASSDHGGVDIAFAPGTQLRYKGQGSVSTYAGKGAAGNVSTLKTGPYELNVFHLSDLPGAAQNKIPADQSTPPIAPPAGTDSRTEDILKAFLYGAQSKESDKKEETIADKLKAQLLGSVISQAIAPTSFLSSYANQDPYMAGFTAGSSDYFKSIYG